MHFLQVVSIRIILVIRGVLLADFGGKVDWHGRRCTRWLDTCS